MYTEHFTQARRNTPHETFSKTSHIPRHKAKLNRKKQIKIYVISYLTTVVKVEYQEQQEIVVETKQPTTG